MQRDLTSRKFYSSTVGLTVLEWGFALLHRQAARGALTADGWGVSLVSTSDGWSYPNPFWRLGVRTLSPLSRTVRPLQVTLHLNQDDTISLEIAGRSADAFLHDDDRHFTHFTGFMLEEEVSASLWDFVLRDLKKKRTKCRPYMTQNWISFKYYLWSGNGRKFSWLELINRPINKSPRQLFSEFGQQFISDPRIELNRGYNVTV